MGYPIGPSVSYTKSPHLLYRTNTFVLVQHLACGRDIHTFVNRIVMLSHTAWKGLEEASGGVRILHKSLRSWLEADRAAVHNLCQ